MLPTLLIRARQAVVRWLTKRPTMDTNPIEIILGPLLNVETKHFLYLCCQAVIQDPAPVNIALSRFDLRTVDAKKCLPEHSASEHEFVVAAAGDSQAGKPFTMKLILERTVHLPTVHPNQDQTVDTPDENAIKSFLAHPHSRILLNAIENAEDLPLASTTVTAGTALTSASVAATCNLPSTAIASGSVAAGAATAPQIRYCRRRSSVPNLHPPFLSQIQHLHLLDFLWLIKPPFLHLNSYIHLDPINLTNLKTFQLMIGFWEGITSTWTSIELRLLQGDSHSADTPHISSMFFSWRF